MKLVESTEQGAHETYSRWKMIATWRQSVVVVALEL